MCLGRGAAGGTKAAALARRDYRKESKYSSQLLLSGQKNNGYQEESETYRIRRTGRWRTNTIDQWNIEVHATMPRLGTLQRRRVPEELSPDQRWRERSRGAEGAIKDGRRRGK
ncbi:hypothetical protein MJO29_002102 [Puccinia striiformis f. sp. tritici]|nr:hypothetical protein MJO29_002102 [Puccinia striiformis f. sp. tritici]